MTNVLLNTSEIKWILRHTDFRMNAPLGQKLKGKIRMRELLVGDAIHVLDSFSTPVRVLETFAFPSGGPQAGDGPWLGFVTDEQYFTDPEMKKIHFCETGFCFLTEGKKIWLIHRETGEFLETGLRKIESKGQTIHLDSPISYLQLDDEFLWFESSEDRDHADRVRKGKERLGLDDPEMLCPKCYGSELLRLEGQTDPVPWACETCEEIFVNQGYGWVSQGSILRQNL